MKTRTIQLAVLIFLFVTIGCSGNGAVEIAVVHIPDPEVEQLIRNRLNIPTGDLHPDDMAKVTFLIFNNVTSLEGLQYCVYLDQLKISHCPGIDLSPIQNLPNITSLEIIFSPGINIEHLRNLTSLQRLSLHDCGINDITPLEGMTEMERLSLSKNEISDISTLRNMTLLDYLNLNDNMVADIEPLSELRELRFLDMHFNLISNVDPLKYLTQLHRVSISGNQVSDITGLVENIGLGEDFDPNPQPDGGTWDGFGGGGSGGYGGGYGDPGGPADNFDAVYLNYNPLSNYAVDTQIPILEARGVVVGFIH